MTHFSNHTEAGKNKVKEEYHTNEEGKASVS